MIAVVAAAAAGELRCCAKFKVIPLAQLIAATQPQQQPKQ